MKTKRDGYRNAFKPYTDEEVELILTNAPIERNRKLLAGVLGRSADAIGMVYELAYGPRFLSRFTGEKVGGLGPKIAQAKKKLGLFIALAIAVGLFSGCASIDRGAKWFFRVPEGHQYNQFEKKWETVPVDSKSNSDMIGSGTN